MATALLRCVMLVPGQEASHEQNDRDRGGEGIVGAVDQGGTLRPALRGPCPAIQGACRRGSNGRTWCACQLFRGEARRRTIAERRSAGNIGHLLDIQTGDFA